MYEQLSLFQAEKPTKATAVCCMDSSTLHAHKPEAKIKELVPESEYVVYVGGHLLALKPTKLTPEKIPDGHKFYHYMINEEVYAGIFVGTEKDNDITKEETQ